MTGGHHDAVGRWRSRVHGLGHRRGDRCVGDGCVFIKVISERGVGAGGLGGRRFRDSHDLNGRCFVGRRRGGHGGFGLGSDRIAFGRLARGCGRSEGGLRLRLNGDLDFGWRHLRRLSGRSGTS